MFRFLRKLRQQLLSRSEFSKYLFYAIGEIVLVVFGILIALQINNRNDLRKEREKELHYLQNIKTDLKYNIEELERYIGIRNQCIELAQTIIDHIEGKPIEDIEAFSDLGMPIYNWQKFYQNNNTFQELINSGNLALLSNDSIKNLLLDIESLYKKMKSEEDHYRFDTEELIYKPLYNTMDLVPMISNFEYRATNGASGNFKPLPDDYFNSFLSDSRIKNGFMMTILEFSTMNGQMEEMKQMSLELIRQIDREMQQ